uniref:Uncharacterized protein n=1 Tax=Glossina austeni TaxID=7395 RepID=A0A1A9V2C8_GLOAU
MNKERINQCYQGAGTRKDVYCKEQNFGAQHMCDQMAKAGSLAINTTGDSDEIKQTSNSHHSGEFEPQSLFSDAPTAPKSVVNAKINTNVNRNPVKIGVKDKTRADLLFSLLLLLLLGLAPKRSLCVRQKLESLSFGLLMLYRVVGATATTTTTTTSTTTTTTATTSNTTTSATIRMHFCAAPLARPLACTLSLTGYLRESCSKDPNE